MEKRLNIVLYEPLIPQNTGNILRTCVAIGARLHLIEPLGFKLDNKELKRSGLDYFKHSDYIIYPDFDNFIDRNEGNFFFFSRYGLKTYNEIEYQKLKGNIYLIFGKETTGIDKKILANNLDKTYRIPTLKDVRSLNLSNCVALVSYNMLERLDFLDLEKYEPEEYKGKDFLKQFE